MRLTVDAMTSINSGKLDEVTLPEIIRTPVSRDGSLVCTFQQEGMWFEHQLNPLSAAYHIALALRLAGPLDIAALQRALLALVVRHEALRTRFIDHGGLPRQIIDPPPGQFPLPVHDIDPGQVKAWAAEQVARPMDLARGPLFRAALARTGTDQHVLVLVVHHIVGDGWSARIVAGELSRLYTADTTGTDVALAPLPIQPADHAAWQRRWLDEAELDRQLGFWRDTLTTLPTVDFPADRPRPAEPAGAGAIVERHLPDQLGAAIRGYTRTHQVSFLAVLHAALLTVLHRWTGQTDLPIGSVFSGRTRPETEPMVGYFVNAVVLRTRIDGNPTFTDLVRRCHDTVLDATARQDIPFSLIVDALQPDRIHGRNPLFQINLVLQPGDTYLTGLCLGHLDTAVSEPATGYTQFDVDVQILQLSGGRLGFRVIYSTELFDADRIERLLDHLTAALTGGLAAPDRPATDIELMGTAEYRHAVHAGNPPRTGREPGLLHSVTAGHDPASVAIRFRGPSHVEEVTYGELEQRANRLAHALRQAGVTTGDVVALMFERGPHLTVAQLAVMKAGGVWMPLDPQNPPARLGFQIGDAAARLVLTSADLADLAERADRSGPTATGTPLWPIDAASFQAGIDRQPASPPASDVRPDDAAYLLYTSGSTGLPKGVLVAHRSAYAYCQNAVQQFGSSSADRVAQISNTTFDATIFDCFATLLAGATLISAPREVITDPVAFTALLREEQVTLSYIPPAILAVLDPAQLVDSALRATFSAGEALPAEQVKRWSRPGLELHNSYGPTETTVVCTDYVCPVDGLHAPTPIGTPLPDHRAYVLDSCLRPAPIGVPGQLFIAGTGLAHGYLNRPALTAERFLADPFSDRPGERMYATGDLVCRRPDGILDFLGRTDRQVKLRGQRVELGEIEHALTQHPAVRHAVVQVRDNAQLTAYLVADADTINAGDIREFLANRLPTYMIPASYLTLPELPLTANGKLDTAALPDPTPTATAYVAPRTSTEQWLAAAWAEVLGIDQPVGVTDNFFDIGGNSLHATQVIARIRDQFGIRLHPRHFFTSPLIEQLAARIDHADQEPVEQVRAELDDEIAELERLLAERTKLERVLAEKRAAKAKRAQQRQIVPVSRDGSLVCTFQQEGMWFEHQLNPLSARYHIAFALRLAGPLDIAALQRALLALVVRHEALRTRFIDHGGLPRQIIDPPPGQFPLPVHDIDPGQVKAWAAEQVARPMDLARGPLFRAALARTGTDQHVLVLVVHHIVGDGWSARIVAGELSRLYTADTTGTDVALAPLPIQPADHAAWQRRWLDEAELDRQLGFWRDTLTTLPTVDFPADRPRPAEPAGAGAIVERHLPDQLGAAIRGYTRTHQVSFLAVLHAALLTVLHRWTGQTDLPIGSVFSGRTRPETEPMVGYFVNAVVLRTRIDGNPTFTDLVRRCHDTVLDATARQDIPFSLIVDALQPDRIHGRNPLFQINLVLQPGDTYLTGLCLGHLDTAVSEPATGYTQFDVDVQILQLSGGRLGFRVIYSTELFDADRIERLLDHLTAALTGGLAAPDRPATDIELMGTAEYRHAVHAGNPPRTGREPGLLHSVTAGHDPASVAIRFRGPSHVEEVTYGELEQRANRLAHALRQAGVTTGDVVALMFERGPHLTVAQLAVMKAGGVWMPLDPQNPPARLGFQIGDAAARLVLTSADLADLAERADRSGPTATGTPLWPIDAASFQAGIDRQPASPPASDVRPDDAAYLLYTSGSTGLPKGVLVAHRSAYAYCQNAVQQFGSSSADRVAQISNTTFDATIFDCFATLLAGATLISAPREVITDPVAFTALLREEQVTLSYIPPAILAVLDPAQLVDSALRATFSAGEALPAEQVKRWSRPGLELHNSYGPTETTVVCTDYVCPVDGLHAPTPIGTPLPDHRAYVLDSCLRPAPIGVPGQLFIAGTGLAHGYLNRPALTAERFLADPFSDRPGERMYATGDLVCRRPDGILDFLGRTDRQVKLRGQRVELGEIEHALTQHPAVRHAVVQVRDNAQLTAYLVADADTINAGDIREFLANRLPTYMIPASYLTLPELPLTANGKLDTAALPDPTPTATAYVAPRTSTEQWLAAAWAEVLGIDQPVGVTDNFFDIGGNSLHATQVIARIRDQFGIRLHPRHFFTSPLIEQLAARIDHAVGEHTESAAPAQDALSTLGSDSGIVAFRSTGSRPPLFLVHPVGGSVTCYAQLAQAVGDDQPVYAIEDPALYGEPSADDLVGRASRYAELIRRQQPGGPYLIGGWSLGGLIAHEMARQLAVAGSDVTVFALDTGTPPMRRIPTDIEVGSEFVVDLAGIAGAPLPDIDLATLEAMDRDSLEQLALDVLIEAGVATPQMRAELRTRMLAFAANYRAVLGHEPGQFDGLMVLITAAESEAMDAVARWACLATALEHRTVSGDHYTMLRAPHLSTLAATLRDALDRAIHGSPAPVPQHS
jgi:amino acid adenylation domain-containing protein